MVDYEKGSSAWDIGMVLTRHHSHRAGFPSSCDRVKELMRSATVPGLHGKDRLDLALMTPCTCPAGDSIAERTSLKGEISNGKFASIATPGPTKDARFDFSPGDSL